MAGAMDIGGVNLFSSSGGGLFDSIGSASDVSQSGVIDSYLSGGGGMFPWKGGPGAPPPAPGVGGFGSMMKSFGAAKGGEFLSMLGAKGGAGTGGQFTQIGSLFGPAGMAVGAVFDLGLSSSMANKAQKKAKKAANAYWLEAQKELGQIRKQQQFERGGTIASMGASGASLGSGSSRAYRNEQKTQQDFAYDRQFKEFYANYRKIKKSGGKGGLF